MCGVRGCFACGKDHRDNDGQSRDEVHRAVQKLTEMHPKPLLTVDDMTYGTLQLDPKTYTVEDE